MPPIRAAISAATTDLCTAIAANATTETRDCFCFLLPLICTDIAANAVTETRDWLPLNFTVIATTAVTETRDCSTNDFLLSLPMIEPGMLMLQMIFTAIAANAAAETRDCCCYS